MLQKLRKYGGLAHEIDEIQFLHCCTTGTNGVYLQFVTQFHRKYQNLGKIIFGQVILVSDAVVRLRM